MSSKTTFTGHPHPIPTQVRSWLKLAPYGDFSHSKGLQRFHKTSAIEIVKYFYSLRGKLSRKFGGLPLYIGHPDEPAYAKQPGHQDAHAYAWITDLRVCHDGLWIHPKWISTAYPILSNGLYPFLSPRWLMRSVDDNTFEPIRLLSVGLTNNPNIPSDSLKKLNTRSLTKNLTHNPNAKSPQNQFIQRVESHHAQTRDQYLVSWIKMKKKYPELYNSF